MVTAYTIDQAGNISEPATKEMKKDSVVPTGELISIGGLSKTITVSVTGEDILSGIYGYKFSYKKETEKDYITAETIKTNEGKCSYKYTNLNPEIIYDIKIIILDKAGNEQEIITKHTTKGEIRIGSYVDYKPTEIIYSNPYIVSNKYSGYSNNQQFTTEDLGWRIWDIDEDNNKLTLISQFCTKTGLRLESAQGYNNCVKILNDLCNACYSNEALGASARSVNYEDYKRVFPENRSDSAEGLKSHTLSVVRSDHSFRIPLIYLEEVNASVDGNPQNPSTYLGQSEQHDYYETNDTSSSYAGTINGFKSIMVPERNFIDPTFSGIPEDWTREYLLRVHWDVIDDKDPRYGYFFATRTPYWYYSKGSAGVDSHPAFFAGVMTRTNAMFGGRRMDGSAFAASSSIVMEYGYVNDYTWGNYTYGVRPVIEIDLTKCIFAETGGGTSATDKFSIRAIGEN